MDTCLRYRPDVDGLRAVAVMAVVLYHAGLGFPGGFVGVDVFFVISGYLISSLILKDLKTNSFSFGDFWVRRIRRILPAMVVTVMTVAVIGYWMLDPESYQKLGAAIMALAAMSANVYFWREDSKGGGYFDFQGHERPLLHTWSLSVEEQFYLFFPLILWGLWKIRRCREGNSLFWILVASCGAGLMLATYGVERSPGAAFYLLPTRMWELMLGATLAALPLAYRPQRRLSRELTVWLGLLGIVVPMCVYDDHTPFPGLAALPACIGTALIIWSGLPGESTSLKRSVVSSLLSWKPVVGIGLISYSLYLWHWPVLILGKYRYIYPGSLWEKHPQMLNILLIVVSLLLSLLGWRYVERPFRERHWIGTRALAYGFATIVFVSFIAVGGQLYQSSGLPSRLPSPVREVMMGNIAASKDWPEPMTCSVQMVETDTLPIIGSTKAGASLKAVLWGDSHGWHTVPAMDGIGKDLNFRVAVSTHSATPPLLDLSFDAEYGLKTDGPQLARAMVKYVSRNKIPFVILCGSWGGYPHHGANAKMQALEKTIAALREAGAQTVVMIDSPRPAYNVPQVLVQLGMFGLRNDPGWWMTEREHRESNSFLYDLTRKGSTAIFLDPTPPLLDPELKRYRVEKDGVSLYLDDNHLTTRAANLYLRPVLEEYFRSALK